MARAAVRESVTLAGRAERARAARAFVSEVLGPGQPCGDVAILLVSLGGENLRRECMVVGVPRVGQGLGEVPLGQAVLVAVVGDPAGFFCWDSSPPSFACCTCRIPGLYLRPVGLRVPPGLTPSRRAGRPPSPARYIRVLTCTVPARYTAGTRRANRGNRTSCNNCRDSVRIPAAVGLLVGPLLSWVQLDPPGRCTLNSPLP